jgi:hypothetical protein
MKDGLSVGKTPEVSQAPQAAAADVIYKSFHPIYGMGGKFPEFTYKSSAAGTPGKKDYEPAYDLRLATVASKQEGGSEAVAVTYKSPGPPPVSRPATKAEAQELLDAFERTPPKAKSPKHPTSAEADAIKQYNNSVSALKAYIDGPTPARTETSSVPKGGYASHPAATAHHVTLPDVKPKGK